MGGRKSLGPSVSSHMLFPYQYLSVSYPFSFSCLFRLFISLVFSDNSFGYDFGCRALDGARNFPNPPVGLGSHQ